MITRNRILFILGLWIVLVPFLGFPSAYKTFFTIVSGVIVVFLAFSYARDKRMGAGTVQVSEEVTTVQVDQEVSTDVYTQNYAVFMPSLDDDDAYTDLDAIRSRSKVKTQ